MTRHKLNKPIHLQFTAHQSVVSNITHLLYLLMSKPFTYCVFRQILLQQSYVYNNIAIQTLHSCLCAYFKTVNTNCTYVSNYHNMPPDIIDRKKETKIMRGMNFYCNCRLSLSTCGVTISEGTLISFSPEFNIF